MESLLNRYRNITVLLLVVLAQLVLLALQVRNDQDVQMIRVWTVTAVTPLARIFEGLRGSSIGFVRDYILLRNADQENRRLQGQVDRLKLENIFLKNELNTSDRARALQVFQAHTPSKTVAANIIGTGAGTNSRVVFVDRGTVAGVMRGMAVVTTDGIVGKVIAAYPTASEVLLITDPDFAAGVVSQNGQVRGTLKGEGKPVCRVDYVPFEEKVQAGEWFYTSGDDRIFPRGFPVGVVKSVRNGQSFKEIYVDPTGLQRGLEDVLILIEGVHQDIPEIPSGNQPVYIAPAPPAGTGASAESASGAAPGGTEADKLRTQYKAIGEAQGHRFGEGAPGSKAPDFNLKVPAGQAPGAAAPKPAQATPQPAGALAAPKPAAAQPSGVAKKAAPVTGQPATVPPPVKKTPQEPVKKAPQEPAGPGVSGAIPKAGRAVDAAGQAPDAVRRTAQPSGPER